MHRLQTKKGENGKMKSYPWCFRNYKLYQGKTWFCENCYYHNKCKQETNFTEQLKHVTKILNKNPTLKLQLFPWLLSFHITEEEWREILVLKAKLRWISRWEKTREK